MVYCTATMKVLLLFAALLLPPFALAQSGEAVELEGTRIIGDRELPIGLYISPWRSADPEQGIDRPSRYLDVGTRPLDPEEFRREAEYLNALDAAAAQRR